MRGHLAPRKPAPIAGVVSNERSGLQNLLMLAGVVFMIMTLVRAVELWQDATAISCRDDPQHDHVVYRLADGTLQYWTHEQ